LFTYLYMTVGYSWLDWQHYSSTPGSKASIQNQEIVQLREGGWC